MQNITAALYTLILSDVDTYTHGRERERASPRRRNTYFSYIYNNNNDGRRRLLKWARDDNRGGRVTNSRCFASFFGDNDIRYYSFFVFRCGLNRHVGKVRRLSRRVKRYDLIDRFSFCIDGGRKKKTVVVERSTTIVTTLDPFECVSPLIALPRKSTE